VSPDTPGACVSFPRLLYWVPAGFQLIMEQKDFFNSLANSWDARCPHDMKKVEYILDLLGIREGNRILDVGTGTGVLVPGLSRRVADAGFVKAVDVAEKMIEIARSKHAFSNVGFHCADALEESDDDAQYDHIICYSMFPHFPDQIEAVKKLSAKLKTGGKLAICHSESRNAINALHARAASTVTSDKLPDMPTLRRFFADSGLKIAHEIDTEEMFVIAGQKHPVIQ